LSSVVQLLLHPLEHLQRGRDQVIRAFIAGEGVVAELPHELAGEDPPVGAGQDPESRWHSDRAAVGAQPSQSDGVKRPHRRGDGIDLGLDALPHLRRGPLGEGHDQDRSGRHATADQPAETFHDDRRLAGARARDHADGAAPDGRRRALLEAQASVHWAGVEWPIRTRIALTLRPS